MDKYPVSERIKILFEEFGNGNISAFARSISVNHQTVRDLIKGEKGGPSWPVLQNILQSYPLVRLEWLMLGEGEMLKTPPIEDTPPNISVVSAPPQDTRSATQTFHGGMALRNYGEGAPRKPIADTSAQPTATTPPVGTDLVKLVADHDTQLTRHESALAELQQLVVQLQKSHKN